MSFTVTTATETVASTKFSVVQANTTMQEYTIAITGDHIPTSISTTAIIVGDPTSFRTDVIMLEVGQPPTVSDPCPFPSAATGGFRMITMMTSRRRKAL